MNTIPEICCPKFVENHIAENVCTDTVIIKSGQVEIQLLLTVNVYCLAKRKYQFVQYKTYVRHMYDICTTPVDICTTPVRHMYDACTTSV